MKTPIPQGERCQGRMMWSGPHDSQYCSRRATIVEDGKRYCRQHTPSLMSAKYDVRNAALDARFIAARQRATEKERQQESDAFKLRAYDGLLAAGAHIIHRIQQLDLCPLCGEEECDCWTPLARALAKAKEVAK